MDNYKNGDLVTWNYFNNKKTALNLTEVEAIRFQTAFTLKHRTDLLPTSEGVKNVGELDTSDVFEVVARNA